MVFLLMSVAALLLFCVFPGVSLVYAWQCYTQGGRRRASVWGAAAVVVAGVGVDAFFLEPHDLEVTHTRITSDKLDEGLLIAVLADIQTDDPGEYERSVFERVAAANPDIVLLPGDFVQVRPVDFPRTSRQLRALLLEVGLRPRLGAFAVPGNAEVGNAQWPSSFRGTEIETWVAQESRDLGPLILTGLPLLESFDAKLKVAQEDKFHLVFGHAPDFSLGEVNADLLVAGHTHGGQVRLPFIGPLVTFSKVPNEQAAGHTLLDSARHLVVSRGIGMERGPAPRLRFLCRPELAFIHLDPASPGQASVGQRMARTSRS